MPWAQGKCHSTIPHMLFLSEWARLLSWQEVSRRFKTSWRKVCEAVTYVVQWGLEHRDMTNITAIGVDEISIRKGHKYLTLVYQINENCKRLLWVGENRDSRTMIRFFYDFGVKQRKKIKYVCSDMWKPYLNVIKKRIPQAVHILDRFHIMQKINKAIDEVRATEYRQLKADGKEPVLKNSRWCLLKRKENLTENQETKLNELLRYNIRSVRAYLLKEDFHGLWNYVSPAWAGKFIDRWTKRVMYSRIDPMKKIAKMIRKHKPLILNWFKAKGAVSTGVVEGMNNRIKVTVKKSYGFRTFKIMQIALYHELGKLPVPELTHRLW
jgi:transposase